MAPWGSVYVVSSLFQLVALPFDAAGDPLFTTPAAARATGYTVSPPAAHTALRAVFFFAASAGVVAGVR